MRPVRLLVLLVGGVLAVTACGDSTSPQGSKAFCDAADRYNTELERQQKRGTIDVERQTTRVEALARSAPAAIRTDAQRFADAMRQVATDPSVTDDPGVKRSVEAVNRYANQACGLYGSGGGI